MGCRPGSFFHLLWNLDLRPQQFKKLLIPSLLKQENCLQHIAIIMDEPPMQKVLSSNHHKNVLSEMFKFLSSQCLTDVTFVCKESREVHAHRKVLVNSSSLVRKIASTRPKDERLVIVVDDIAQEIMNSFLSLIYKGEAKQVCEEEINQVNQICHLLGSDVAAYKLNKTAPKESPVRKKRVLLGGKQVVSEKEKTSSPPATTKIVEAKEKVVKKEVKKEVKNEAPSITPTQKPTVKRKRNSEKEDTAIKYCLCREPERPGMIGCDFCEEWYHSSCLNLKKEDVKQLTKCKWKYMG